MSDEIFRKKSLDKVKSPENLDDYIHVSNPGIWLLLISIIVLLAGACVWGIFGHIESTAPTTVHVEEGSVTCFVEEKDISSVHKGMSVRFDEYEAVITEIGKKEETGYVCTLQLNSMISDGFYEGKIITERVKPLSFVLN